MKKGFFVCLTLIFLSAAGMNAQVLIGSDLDASAEPHPGAILDLRSDTQGLKLPAVSLGDVTDFQLGIGENSEGAGMIVFNTNPATTGGQGVGLYIWNGVKWIFAGISGPVAVPVTAITVSGEAAVTSGKTSTYTYSYEPDDATNHGVRWSIVPGGTGSGSIDETSGLFTAALPGTVFIRATATDGSGVFDQKTVTVAPVANLVTGISIAITSGTNPLTLDQTLQLTATVTPTNAGNPAVTWSRETGTSVTVSSAGLVTPAAVSGSTTIRACAQDGSEVCSPPITVTMATLTTGTVSSNPYACYPSWGCIFTRPSVTGSASYTISGRKYWTTTSQFATACPSGWSVISAAKATSLSGLPRYALFRAMGTQGPASYRIHDDYVSPTENYWTIYDAGTTYGIIGYTGMSNSSSAYAYPVRCYKAE